MVKITAIHHYFSNKQQAMIWDNYRIVCCNIYISCGIKWVTQRKNKTRSTQLYISCVFCRIEVFDQHHYPMPLSYLLTLFINWPTGLWTNDQHYVDNHICIAKSKPFIFFDSHQYDSNFPHFVCLHFALNIEIHKPVLQCFLPYPSFIAVFVILTCS